MDEKLIADFNKDMLLLYQKAVEECRYRPTRYFQMLQEHGGLPLAKKFLRSKKIHEGLVKLYSLGRLDLTVEYLVTQEKYKDLFTKEEIKIAKKKLKELNFAK